MRWTYLYRSLYEELSYNMKKKSGSWDLLYMWIRFVCR